MTTKFPKLRACVVEPGDDITEYQHNVNKGEYGVDGIEFEWHNKTLQDFINLKASDQTYHFISAIHVIYLLGDIEDAIKSLWNMLEPGGIIFLDVMTGTSNFIVI